MRTSVTTTVLLGTLLLGFSAKGVQAADLARMNIPFPFEVNGETLPAGKYDIRTDDENPAVLMITGIAHTKGTAMIMTMPEYGKAPSGDRPAMVFVRDGNQYRLSKVWENRDFGRDVVVR